VGIVKLHSFAYRLGMEGIVPQTLKQGFALYADARLVVHFHFGWYETWSRCSMCHNIAINF